MDDLASNKNDAIEAETSILKDLFAMKDAVVDIQTDFSVQSSLLHITQKVQT